MEPVMSCHKSNSTLQSKAQPYVERNEQTFIKVVSVDGRRHLKNSKEAKKNSLKARAGGSERLRNGEKVVGTSEVEYVDDFRPTTPGHSPGVGHSVHN
ncbi:hypothetical protein ACSBR1_010167 [Camellia fascicularis]